MDNTNHKEKVLDNPVESLKTLDKFMASDLYGALMERLALTYKKTYEMSEVESVDQAVMVANKVARARGEIQGLKFFDDLRDSINNRIEHFPIDKKK